MSDDHAAVYRDGELIVYRASAIGSCLPSLVAARRGYDYEPPPDSLERRFEDGKLHEPDILEQLKRKYGFRLLGAGQQTVELRITDQIIVRGHIDEIAEPDPSADVRAMVQGGTRVVDAKALAESTFKLWQKDQLGFLGELYDWQMSAYMLAKGLPGMFAVKNKNSGVVELEFIDEYPVSLAQITAKVLRVEMLSHGEDFPDCETPTRWPCPVAYLNLHDDKPTAELDDDELLESLSRRQVELRSAADKIKTERKTVDEELKKVLGGRKKVKTVAHDVVLVEQQREYFERNKAEAVVGDLSPFYRKKSISFPKATPRKK